MKCLIVEDDPALAAQLAQAMRDGGFACDIAHDGTGGEFLGATESYDLAVLDLGLPGLPGMSGMPGMTGGRGPSLPPAQSLGQSLGGEVESTRIMDTKGILEAARAPAPAQTQSESTVFSDGAGSEKSVYADGGKSNRKKPVADVKARSKAKVTPVDPGRLLVQQEAAEQRHKEATMMGTLDQFLDKQQLAKLDDIPVGEGTMVGKFLGFVGFGAQGSNLAIAPIVIVGVYLLVVVLTYRSDARTWF